jgi:hypothetical protein
MDELTFRCATLSRGLGASNGCYDRIYWFLFYFICEALEVRTFHCITVNIIIIMITFIPHALGVRRFLQVSSCEVYFNSKSTGKDARVSAGANKHVNEESVVLCDPAPTNDYYQIPRESVTKMKRGRNIAQGIQMKFNFEVDGIFVFCTSFHS